MDFTQHYFGANQPYQFTIGIPPLTPSHSNSAGSEDFNTTSPPEVFDGFANEPFQQFDGFNHFNPPAAFPGPPTPPNNANGHGGVTQVAQQQQQATPAAANIQPHPDLVANGAGANGQMGNGSSADEQQRRGGSNSDEDELTPAQSRRKAQNRAAQRAFRERKERHVKDLEAKLATLEAAQQQTATENERLKKEMQKISTENEILRATSGPGSAGGANGVNGHSRSSLSPSSHHAPPTTTGPLQYNPTDFYSNVLSGHANKTLSHRIVTSEDGERLYAAGATWDFIIGHELYRKGLVDVGDVSERLKHKAKCDGQGPVFEERAIVEAIEQSVASGSDELL